MSFDTPLVLSGPLRRPRQMLADQAYGGHASIHDDAMAEKLGFKAGPIEGPTHFSQFAPLMARLWGPAAFERGCLSAHYQNMVVEGEEVRASAEWPAGDADWTRAWAHKADGTPVLEASLSMAGAATPPLLEQRLTQLRPPGRLVILADLSVGQRGLADEPVRMDVDTPMGALYPFSLRDKLARITEPSPWYTDGATSPWGRPIIPLEMISVLAEYSVDRAGFAVKGPAVGLFADQQIRLVDGPLFVGEDYLVRREVVALSETRRTESYWVRSGIYDAAGRVLKAEVLLNHAVLKHSYAGYPADATPAPAPGMGAAGGAA